jgi:hypothetical protein
LPFIFILFYLHFLFLFYFIFASKEPTASGSAKMKATTRGMIGVRAVRPNLSSTLDRSAIPRIATGTAALRTRSAIPSPALQLRRNISQLLAQRPSSSLPIINNSRFSIHFASRRYASTSTEEAPSSDAKRTEEDANNTTTTQTRATAGELELIYDAPKKGCGSFHLVVYAATVNADASLVLHTITTPGSCAG